MNDLYTKQLHLRKIVNTDAPKLFEIWSDPDVTKYMNVEPFNNEKQALDMISFLNKLTEENKAMRFSIIHKETNILIGSCGFNSIDFENSKTEIGYELARAHWGKGYASEFISILVKTAFHTLELNRVEAKVEPENVNSIKVLEKLDFIFEGILRQSEKSKGEFIDLNLYSRLKTD